MSTLPEEGLPRVKTIRHRIETLRNRRDFLLADIECRKGEGRLYGFQADEVEALSWAIPVLETEWDNLARIRRNIQRVENRLGALEGRGITEDDRGRTPPWVLSDIAQIEAFHTGQP